MASEKFGSGGLGQMLSALRHRNYRLFFFGQGVSVIGTWMQATALGWLVYEMTGSRTLLGVVAFAGQVPTFALSPLAGVLADRIDRRRLVTILQSLAALQAAVLAVLTLAGWIHVWHIVALALAAGMIMSFDIPIRQSFVMEMVEDRADLPNAIALNSFLVNGGRIIGPAIAGLQIFLVSRMAGGAGRPQFLGEGVCFALNAVSYLAVVAALVAMRIRPRPPAGPRRRVLHELREGFRYAVGFPPIRYVLALLCLVNLVGAYNVLLPVYAKDILRGDERTLGFLMSAIGIGAVMGAGFLAWRRRVPGIKKVIVIGTALFGAGIIAFSLSHAVWLSELLLMVAGFGFMIQMVGSNTLLQTIVDEDKRGRLMGFYTISFMGMAPFGSLLAGWLSSRGMIGPEWYLIASGICCIAAAILFNSRVSKLQQLVRPIYVRLGLLPAEEI